MRVVIVLVACLALVGCKSDSGCERLGDLAQACEPLLSDEDRENQVALCKMFVSDSVASACADCREAAADPCGTECDSVCGM